MSSHKIIQIECPGCGKALHTFHIPSKPGIYRLRCQADRDKPVTIEVVKDGTIKRVDT